MSDTSRFFEKVVAGPSGCHVWTGALTRGGYGRFWTNDGTRHGKTVLAHRFIYETVRGTIPEALTVDHRCKNERCVNIEHLGLETLRDNVMMGDSLGAVNARKDVCRNGHPFDYAHPDGSRQCRTCRKAREAARYLTKKGK